MKYTLNCYGWSGDFIAQKITDEQVVKLEELMEKNGVSDPSDVYFDIEDKVGIDPSYGELLTVVLPFDNETMSFELLDETGDIILSFDITDINTIETIDDDYEISDEYDLFTGEGTNVFLTIFESKGGLYSFEFESDEEPTIDDFSYDQNVVSSPYTDWDIIDGIYFKKKKLEIYEMLDNDGKATTVEIFKY